jgi:hypothetical protein
MINQQPIIEKQEILYTPTTMNAPLPSLGKIYPEDSLLHNKENILIREMSGVEEDILTSTNLLKTGKAMDIVLKNCILEKDIDVNTMILGDRNSILISLMLASYGSSYKVDILCPNCGEKTKEYEFKIADLPIKNLSVEPDLPGKNEFSFTLPKSNLNIKFRLLTHSLDKEIKDTVDRLKNISTDNREKYSTTRLKYEIISINNIIDKNKINSIIDTAQIPIQDSIAIREYIDSISPDIITKQEFKCKHCNETELINIPIDFSFFWRTGK